MNLTFWKKPDETAEEAKVTEQPVPEVPVRAPDGAPDSGSAAAALSDKDRARIEAGVIEALSGVYDPEIPVNIYELGLIYDIEVTPQADVVIEMTLTSPACPVAGSLPGEVEAAAAEVEGVRAVDVQLVWNPPWTPDRMSEAAKLELGFM